MNSAIKTLCNENIKTKSDYRRWSKLNHPDKILNSSKKEEATKKFSNVSTKVKQVFDDKDSIDCLNSKQNTKNSMSTPEKQPRKPMSTENINLTKAECIRNIENWSKIQKHQRFDKKSFNPEQFQKDISYSSPKMNELISTIRDLDKKDFEKHGKYFKHFIFSDVKKGGYGAKIIASSLVSVGFNHCFTPSLKIITPKNNKQQETFGVLSSTSIFDTSFTQKHVQNILNMYNKRPDNIHGENMRFIVLDSGFKEGVDLFDVKYVHIFENQKNNADLVQAIGRATRSCGQKGLHFVPNKGWKLHVYQYYLTDLNNNMVFNDYIKFAGIDINMLEISENIQKLAMISAVDRDLNEEINKYQQQVDEQVDALELEYSGGNDKLLGCNGGKCGKRSTKDIPFSLKQLLQAYKKRKPRGFNKLSSFEKRKFFCELLKTDPNFCKQVNEIFHSIKQKNTKLKKTSDSNKQIVLYKNNDENSNSSEKQLVIKDTQFQNIDLFENYNSLETFVELENLPFDEFRKRINKIFSAFKYKPIKVEILCATGSTNKRIVNFTESQQFVTNYFIPNHFAKGILIWHSVGTGKTCTAISVKSFLFEKSDYSIIWVTRSTLKEDIWKNMYESICDHVIREKFLNGMEESKLRKSMYSRFFPPMSYKQFSNLLEGKNNLYSKLTQLNGTTDILKNTLIIFDEAHKLYSKDLIGIEKPNMSVIEDKIGKSTTCKVMLMTGTPIADDPMEFFKLMNLIIKKNPFPTNFKVFDEEYLDGNNFSKKGAIKFQEKTKGLISYLDRRYDPRQFTQIEFYKKPVTLSVDSFVYDKNCKADAKEKLKECTSEIKNKELNLKDELRLIDSLSNEIEDLKSQLKISRKEKNKVKVEYLVNLINFKKEQIKELKKNIKESKKQNTKNSKLLEQSCKSDYKQSIQKCKDDEKRQKNSLYQNVLFEHC